MRNGKGLATAGLLAVTMLGQPLRAEVTIDDIVKDASTPGDVVTNGLGPQGQRFSPLTAINTETVSKLVPMWAFSLGGEKQRGQETQPLVQRWRDVRHRLVQPHVGHRHQDRPQIWEYNHRLPEGILALL